MSLLEPISSDSYVGNNFTDDDKYLELEVEIEQSFSDVNQTGVDWNFVIKRSEEILLEHSKDMKVLSYWLYAQWKFNGWTAFFEAFSTFASLLARYNKELYPSKEKRKVKILEWIDKVFEKPLEENIKEFSKEQLGSLVGIFSVLEEGLNATLEGKVVFLKPAHEEAKRLLMEIKRREEQQAKEAEAFKDAQKKRSKEDKELQAARLQKQKEDEEVISKFQTKTSIGDIVESDINEKALTYDDIVEHTSELLSICKTLFAESPGEYLPFNLLFSYATIILEEVLHDTKIKTDKLLPSTEVIAAIRDSLDNTITLQHLIALEEQLLKFPSWLEGYYLAARMLHRLNRAEVAQKVEKLLYHYMEKEELCVTFSSSIGTKLVPVEIETWAKQKILSLRGKGDSDVEYKKVYQEALALKAKENAQNALEFLETKYKRASSAEAKYKWRLVVIEFLLETGDKRLALALLLELEQQIETYKLDIWQPNLAIQTYDLLLKPIVFQELGKENQERIYKKLSILDLQKVLKF